jgi:hypothetical protein
MIQMTHLNHNLIGNLPLELQQEIIKHLDTRTKRSLSKNNIKPEEWYECILNSITLNSINLVSWYHHGNQRGFKFTVYKYYAENITQDQDFIIEHYQHRCDHFYVNHWGEYKKEAKLKIIFNSDKTYSKIFSFPDWYDPDPGKLVTSSKIQSKIKSCEFYFDLQTILQIMLLKQIPIEVIKAVIRYEYKRKLSKLKSMDICHYIYSLNFFKKPWDDYTILEKIYSVEPFDLCEFMRIYYPSLAENMEKIEHWIDHLSPNSGKNYYE